MRMPCAVVGSIAYIQSALDFPGAISCIMKQSARLNKLAHVVPGFPPRGFKRSNEMEPCYLALDALDALGAGRKGPKLSFLKAGAEV